LSPEEIKALVEHYPFLLPINVHTDEVVTNYDYTYFNGMELPDGWLPLFFQMCEDIKQPLINAGCLYTFRFTQIKEKYNEMRCYCNRAPASVYKIIKKYEQMSYYICTRCGKPADWELQGYYMSVCTDCWKDLFRHEQVLPIKFKDYYILTSISNSKKASRKISFKNEWKRYIERLSNNN
jgi:hypothetical protein